MMLIRGLLFLCLPLATLQESRDSQRLRIAYLMQSQEITSGIERYLSYKKELGKHDFELLSQMALALLEQGAKSSDPESQLLSIYGSGVATALTSLDILETGIKSSHPETQVASIQYLGRFQDDRSDELLLRAMSSEYFLVRLEAAYHLAQRKHRACVGQIESLMYRVPPELRAFFPQFFALIGTQDALSILRSQMEDRYLGVRVEALLCAARFGRDDLLPSIRASLTHLNAAEQEAAAYAAGLLRDAKSLQKLRRLQNSSFDNVQIAASKSLYLLGETGAKELLLSKAENLNLFAIAALGEIGEGKELLARLSLHPDKQVRLNASASLVKLRDPRCLKGLLEILIRDERDLGFQPILSLGKSQLAWRAVGSSTQHQKLGPYNIEASSEALRESLLKEALELPEESFLILAHRLLSKGGGDLIPLVTLLLENRATPKSIELLKEKVQAAGAPLVRGYCALVLYRMRQAGPYEEMVKSILSRHQSNEMFRLRPPVSIDQRFTESAFVLTPEDSARLLIDCYQTLADRHDVQSIDILLQALQNGNSKNRYVLAGLLLRALQ